MALKGFIVVLTHRTDKKETVCECNPNNDIESAVDQAFCMKDDLWDCADRNRYNLYIIRLNDGQKIKLKGWKTNYSKSLSDKLDRELEKHELRYTDDTPMVKKIIKEVGYEETDTQWDKKVKFKRSNAEEFVLDIIKQAIEEGREENE